MQKSIQLNIPPIDDAIGGLLSSFIHAVYGESGVGKTFFCLNAIKSLFHQNENAQILFSESSGHLRLSNLKKLLSKQDLIKQIDFFNPKSFTEQIILFKNLLENQDTSYDMIILDTFFGSPLDAIRYLDQNKLVWRKRIFSHLLDLQKLAEIWDIPILVTNHLVGSLDGTKNSSSSKQYGEDILSTLIPVTFFLSKYGMKHFLEIHLFKKLIMATEFILIQI